MFTSQKLGKASEKLGFDVEMGSFVRHQSDRLGEALEWDLPRVRAPYRSAGGLAIVGSGLHVTEDLMIESPNLEKVGLVKEFPRLESLAWLLSSSSFLLLSISHDVDFSLLAARGGLRL